MQAVAISLFQTVHSMAVCFVHQLNTRCFLFQNEARKLNHQEVVEEDKRLKLPSNWEAKKARLEWELADNEKRKVEVFQIKRSTVCLAGRVFCFV